MHMDHTNLCLWDGGFIFSDVTGPTNQLGIYGSYAYNVLVYRDIRISEEPFGS